MLYTVVIVGLVVVLCRYFYIEGVKQTLELYMKIAEEELLDKDCKYWDDDLIKYRKHGLRLKFFAITKTSLMQNYLSVREVAAATLYSAYTEGRYEVSGQ